MKKIVLLLVFMSFSFAIDFVAGFGYGNFIAHTELYGEKKESSNSKNLHYKIGLELDKSRVLLTIDNPDLISGETLTIRTLSWQAIDQPDPYIKGFFGVAISEFDYSNSNIDVSGKQNAYGVELGVMMLEEGGLYENFEMELGYRYFTTAGLTQTGDFELDDFSSAYIGFNFVY